MIRTFKSWEVGFRYQIVQQIAEFGKSPTELSRVLSIDRSTVYRYLWRYRQDGLAGLKNKPRGRSVRKIDPEVENLIVSLKSDKMFRSCRKIQELLKEGRGIKVHEKGVYRVLKAHGMSRGLLPDKKPIRPFVKDTPNTLWQTDWMEDEPTKIGKVHLVVLLDDHSRFLVDGQWFKTKGEEDMLKVLKRAFEKYGLPEKIFSDNGSVFKPTSKPNGQTKYQEILKFLGVETGFSTPYHPQSKGKVEKFFQFAQRDFLWEVRDEIESLADLNRRYRRWVKKYNQRNHAGLKAEHKKPLCPKDLYQPARPVPEEVELDLIFADEEPRRVGRDATIVYGANRYKVPRKLIGCRVWIRVLGSKLEVYYGEDNELAATHRIRD